MDEAELRTNLGAGHYIFVCSGCDLFHEDIPEEWIVRVMDHAGWHPGNGYLWHTKNPCRALGFQDQFREQDMLCVTIESNREYSAITKAPPPSERFAAVNKWKKPWMLTIEPVMDFDLTDLAVMIGRNMPVQVNIGADSGRNSLPEPDPEKLRLLIGWLKTRTEVHLKKNLKRLLPELKEKI
jgi:hypothetical protein